MVSALPESRFSEWLVEDYPALYALFGMASTGTALPTDGQFLPDEAAIVAGLLAASQASGGESASKPAPEVLSAATLPSVSTPPAGSMLSAVSMLDSVSTSAPGSGQRSLGPTTAPAGAQPVLLSQVEDGIDAPRQRLGDALGLSSLIDSVGAGRSAGQGAGQEGHERQEAHTRDPRLLMLSPVTPAREPAVLTSPGASEAAGQARSMGFLLQPEGFNRTWGRERWVGGLSQQLMVMTRDGLGTARLRLDPPSLGTLSIQIQMTEQGASVSFVTPHPLVRDALEQQASRLQELFQDQELNLVDVSVSDQQAGEQDDTEPGTEPWQSASNNSEVEEEIVDVQSHHLISERV